MGKTAEGGHARPLHGTGVEPGEGGADEGRAPGMRACAAGTGDGYAGMRRRDGDGCRVCAL